MKIKETLLRDCFIIQPDLYKDERGYFLESFNQFNFQKATGLEINFILHELFRTKTKQKILIEDKTFF